jgi:hypothetical protein
MDSLAASSPRRSEARSRSGCHRAQHLADHCQTPAVLLRGGHGVCVHARGSAECGAPGGAVVKTPSGSLWPAARALPRHAVQTSAWAYGECDPFPSNPLLSSPAMVFGHLAMSS